MTSTMTCPRKSKSLTHTFTFSISPVWVESAGLLYGTKAVVTFTESNWENDNVLNNKHVEINKIIFMG